MQRIGLFGGTFNPVHHGHLHAAKEVSKRFPLDQIVLIPSALPPHKQPDNLAEAKDRLEMLRLACIDTPGLSLSDVELTRRGPSYTIDTICHFKSTASEDTRLFLIVGIDAFLEIDTWQAYRKLFDQIPFIVISRPINGQRQAADKETKRLANYLKNTLSKEYVFTTSQNGFFHPTRKPVYFLNIDPLAISSTDIRRRISQGEPVQQWVPETVQQYIQQKGLYL